ncbi:MAG TPA: rod shape-determining protein MreC [Solirubrobacteraceae bacterium]|nr:rod shape-determining protein MreC [Solirubrobacteraceae bacterium]
MYEKTVRRRRAVLALLVVLSLILLTAYFGEAPSGGLHSVQRGFLTVVSPIQDGANKALKPVRDLFGWFGSTLKAKSQNAELRKQLDKLRSQYTANQENEHSYRELVKLFHLDHELSIADYNPVTATVVYQSPNIWYSIITIDRGSSSGVRVNDPVIADEALVGKVTEVVPDAAQVSLITDSAVEVTAKISATGAVGLVQPQVGEPGRLLMQIYQSSTAAPVQGDYVVTSGTVASPGVSLYPKGIPIGQVTSVNEQGGFKSVAVSPLADLRSLEFVQVLTYSSGSRAASLNNVAATLTPTHQPDREEESQGQGGQLAQTGGGG